MPHRARDRTARTAPAGRRKTACALGLAAAPLACQYVPALATLGQWTPLRALPGQAVVWRGPRAAGNVALTFDDGPHPVGTPAVLDRLDELCMKASFFPLASLAERQPDLVAEIARRGHTVGTHGYEHVRHLCRGPRWIGRDLESADRTMVGLIPSITWYRPAYGIATGATLLAARARRWRTVLWSAWGREWATRDPVSVAARIGGRLGPGAIVLLHDNDMFGPPGMWRVGLDALELLAERLNDQRLTPVTLDELVA